MKYFYSVLAVVLTSCSSAETLVTEELPRASGSIITSTVVESSAESSVQSSSSSKSRLPIMFAVENSSFIADVALRGYAVTETIDAPLCKENCTTEQCRSECEEFSYVYFVPSEVPHAKFAEFLQQFNGDPFGNKAAIGLGCLRDSQIYYANDSDANGMKEFALTEDFTNALLSASSEKPITVRLTKLRLTNGRGAPTCYSHFTDIKAL